MIFYIDKVANRLIRLPLVPHIYVSDLGQHWFRLWLVACPAPSHYLNQCCLLVNWILGNELQLTVKFELKKEKQKPFIHENAFETVICEMVAILSRGEITVQKTCFLQKHTNAFSTDYLHIQMFSFMNMPWSREVQKVDDMGQVTKLRLSCYLVLLSIDSKTR